MLEYRLWRRKAEPERRSPASPTIIRFFLESPESNRIDVNYLSFNPYNRRAFTLSRGDFVTRAVPEASAIGQLLATR
jgi:hypothetical protein